MDGGVKTGYYPLFVKTHMIVPVEARLPFSHYLNGDYRLSYSVGTCSVSRSSEPNKVATFSDAELAAVDKRIPEILATMTSKEFLFRRNVTTVWVRNTLSFMNDPVSLTDIFGMQWLVKFVSGMSVFEKDRTAVTVSVVYYDFVRLEPVPYITDIKESFITVATKELDKVYPGWLAKYDMLRALGSTKKEVMDGTFTRQIATPVDASALTKVAFE